METIQSTMRSQPPMAQPSANKQGVLKAAKDLEAAFISEMLKASGFGKASESFGGGSGEDQFASFLRDAQAKEIARAGGLGLAQHFVLAMQGDSNA